MPRPRWDRLEEEKRVALLDAAAAEFAAHGYEGASLNRLLAAGGISKGAFYYYFDDKADLFATVADRAWKVLLPAGGLAVEALGAADFWPTLRSQFLDMAARTGDHPWLVGLAELFYHPPQVEGLDELVAAQFGATRRWLGRLLGHGQRLGVVRSDLPHDLLLTVVMAASRAADHWMVDHWSELDEDELEPLLGRLFDLLRRLAEPPGRS
jgi:AcrR family transcriptional regulator